jgi:hypothetical protein
VNRRRAWLARLLMPGLLLLGLGCPSEPDDKVHPVTRFLSPASGDTVPAGIVSMSAIATDDVSVRRVTFWRDSTLLGFDEYPAGDTWSVLVDARTGFPGWRHLAANAIDRAGNQSFDTAWVFFTP